MAAYANSWRLFEHERPEIELSPSELLMFCPCRVLFQPQPSYDKTSLPNAISFNALSEAWADLGAKVSSAAVQRRQDQQGRPRGGAIATHAA
jgi:hypothetical protein